jgi:hypothetical protein
MNLKRSLLGLMLAITSFTTVCAQSLEEIHTKHVAALGGSDQIKAVKAVKMSGGMNANGMKIPVAIQILNGKGFKVEFTAMGMTGYQIVNNTKGWNFSPFQGQTKPEPMTEDDVKKSQDDLEIFNDFIDYSAKGNTAEFLGKDDIEGTECFKIKVTLKSGKEKTLYIASDNYLVLKETEKTTVNGADIEISTMFSNYKKVGAVLFPHTMNISVQGEISFDSIEVNPAIDAKTFEVGRK